MAAPHRRLRALLLIAILAVAALIFLFSAQSGEESADASGRVTDFVLGVLVPGYRQMEAAARQPYRDTAGLIIRKLAHFSEFALLAFLILLYIDTGPRGHRPRASLLRAWPLATLYACTDEIHQRFVSGRAPALPDVAIDSLGALAGAALAAGLLLAVRKRR